jgi:hypothetical protein
MADAALDDAIVRRLNILILLSLDNAGSRAGLTTTGKVQRLVELGLEPAEVASIVGKPVNYITAITSKARRSMREKGKASG